MMPETDFTPIKSILECLMWYGIAKAGLKLLVNVCHMCGKHVPH